MIDADSGLPVDNTRVIWWVFVLALFSVAVFVAYRFISILVLGVFGYYAARPINRYVSSVVDSDGIAAWTSVLLILLPLLGLVFYTGFRVYQQVQQRIGQDLPYERVFNHLSAGQQQMLTSLVQNPQQLLANPTGILNTLRPVLATVSWVVLLVSLAITLTAFLLTNDSELAAALEKLFGGRDTAGYAYAEALDSDFESVYFGNFLFVLAMALIATVTYEATNVFAPAGLHVPMIFVLGALTGVASLIPMVVGKIVYLPVVGSLALQARQSETSLAFVVGVLVVYFLLLDFLPQTFIQPYLSGRKLDAVMMMFGYLLGPIMFGWYGFFLLPMLFIAMLEAVRIVLPNLVHGEPVRPNVVMGDSIGASLSTDQSDSD